ncbi:MAG TPA: DUF397 domain-containing protein [Micromonosporaceae bacterium]
MSITAQWAKSTRSNSGGNCVEVRRAEDGSIQVRDSKDPNGSVLTFGSTQWEAFIGATKRHEFGV